MKIKLVVLVLILFPFQAYAAYLDLPKDTNGWSILTPSEDTKLVYVSTSGDDDTCTYYLPDNALIGANPLSPTGTIVPCETMIKAITLVGYGAPDWILFKRGDTFTGAIGENNRDGRSITEPSVIGSYGATGASPIIKAGSDSGIMFTNHRKYFVLFGIDFYAHTRDPESLDYVGIDGGFGMLFLGGGEGQITEGILVEGCKFRFFADNAMVDFYNDGGGVTLRRNIFLDAYSSGGHSQGLLASNINAGITLEENIFDHNGWLVQNDNDEVFDVGEATMFNHSFYLAETLNTVVRKNISLRPSSINIKFTGNYGAASVGPHVVDNNLTVDGSVGITVAGANTPEALRVNGATITNNVITNLNASDLVYADIGWGIDLLDIDGGIVSSNLIVHNNDSNSHAIHHQGTSRNVSITDNVIYGFQNVSTALNLIDDYGSSVTGMVFSNNKIQNPLNSGYTIYSEYATSGKWTFSGNQYYSNVADGSRFYLTDAAKTNAQWATATGDDSTFEQVTFPDATRSIETYMASLGETATIDAFIAKARAQDRYNWDTRFTADPVNDYIRAGFGVSEYTPPGQARRLSLAGRPIKLAEPGP